jgi:amino acid transporter
MGNRPQREQLRTVIGPGRLILLTFALVAPATSVWLAFGAAYRSAGTGIVLSYGLAGLVNILVMLCYAEVGSLYPEAGGDYALARQALGPRIGAVYALVFAVKGAILPAVLCLGAAAYLHDAWPTIGVGTGAAALLAAAVALGLMTLTLSSAVMAVMVGVEGVAFLALLAVTLTALPGPSAFSPASLVALPSGRWPAVLGGAVPALYAYNGPQAVLYYSEETRAAPRTFGRLIITVALSTVAVEGLGVLLAALAVGHRPELRQVPLPLLALVTGSDRWGRLVLTATGVALFDAAAATLMAYARVLYAVARDGLWPEPLNRRLGHVSTHGVPAFTVACLGLLNFGALRLSTLNNWVVLLGALVLLLYAGIAGAALTTRLRAHPPYRMPFWPVPPLAVLLAIGVLLRVIPPVQRTVLAAVTAAGLLWSFTRRNGGG